MKEYIEREKEEPYTEIFTTSRMSAIATDDHGKYRYIAGPVTRCEECFFRNYLSCMRHKIDIIDLNFYCPDGLKQSEYILKRRIYAAN